MSIIMSRIFLLLSLQRPTLNRLRLLAMMYWIGSRSSRVRSMMISYSSAMKFCTVLPCGMRYQFRSFRQMASKLSLACR